MNTIKYLLTVKLSILLILMVTMLDCGVFKESIEVYVSNLTQSNIHLNTKDGLRIRVGDTTNLPVALLIKTNPSATLKLCRDRGCIAEITVTGDDFPNPDEGEYSFKDTVVLEEPELGTITAYSLLDLVTVSVKTL